MSRFYALLQEDYDGKIQSSIAQLKDEDLPAGEVTVCIDWSSLNYKDALILNNLGRLVAQYPHIPGIDFSGTVEHSDSAKFNVGDKVILTGWRVGEQFWGGFSQKARVRADWLVPLPSSMTTRQAMVLGTAGLTAMLAVESLEHLGLTQDQPGEVLVTGAVGGVGSIATLILSRLGYTVAASTWHPEQDAYLRTLGASVFIDRSILAKGADKPLLTERWKGCVDNVGGPTLSRILAELQWQASVASCGYADGMEFRSTVLPFLVRGVNLLGIESTHCPLPRRLRAWNRLAEILSEENLEPILEEVGLSELSEVSKRILAGQVRGRLLVDVHR